MKPSELLQKAIDEGLPRTTGFLFDGFHSYCALGAIAKMNGASDEFLATGGLGDYDDLGVLEDNPDIRREIFTRNDHGDSWEKIVAFLEEQGL